MMEYLVLAAGIFAVLSLATYFIHIDGWVWRALAIVLGVVSVGLLADWWDCWLGIGVGGIAVLLQRLEDLLMTKSDEAKSNVLNRPRQRPY